MQNLLNRFLLAFSTPLIGLSLSCYRSMPVDGGGPPGIDPSFDFRLTDSEPAWSPDGQWIAYVRSLPDGAGPAGIWTMN
jgi:hypothetical protein